LSALSAAVLAQELISAYANRLTNVVPPSARGGEFTLSDGYAVETELVQWRQGRGHAPVGRKVGYANKALWRVLKLDTLVWAHMYDDTVRPSGHNTAVLSIGRLASPKIEPEIVFKMASAPVADANILEHVEWLALGFEIIDCVYTDWKFQPADFVAAFGLHAALVVGEPLRVESSMIPALTDRLAQFKVRLLRNGEMASEGSGRNSLKSPALCLAELAQATARQPGAAPLGGGELVSSGTLTESAIMTAGERWTAVVDGLSVPPLTLTTEA
jgi:2-oxo-3-hexenedioate decarboxylase